MRAFPEAGGWGERDFERLMDDWAAACPGVEKANLRIADCSEYPCLGEVVWDREQSSADDIWCSEEIASLVVGRTERAFKVGDAVLSGVLFSFSQPQDVEGDWAEVTQQRMNEQIGDMALHARELVAPHDP
jgi:hypothetical protein